MDPTPKHPDVAAMFNRLLQELGISGNQLASTLGTSQQAISNYTSGRNKPGREMLAAISKQYPAISAAWLITGEGEPFPNGRYNEKPKAPQAAEVAPAPGLTIAQPTREEYAALQEEVRKLREQLASKNGELGAVVEERTWLRKQVGERSFSEASAEAADYPEEEAEMYPSHVNADLLYERMRREQEQQQYGAVAGLWIREAL